MHFSIPYTQEFIDDGGNAYLGYNIHINGLFHCTVRYKQLLNLHVQLGREIDANILPEFPPKKLFPLTVNQQEERRSLLEKYVQTIGQNSTINSSQLLNGFFLKAQQETAGENSSVEQDLDVFLINGYKITVSASPGENSDEILNKVCRSVGLQEKYVRYFALFLVHQEDDDGNINVLRKLQNFESPLITLKNIPLIGVRIILGKTYWDPGYDDELMHDEVALDLIYVQAVSDVDRGWVSVPDEHRDRLRDLRASGSKKEYLRLARSLKYYGYMRFAACLSDYPQPGTRVFVSIGRNELSLRIYRDGEDECEAVFKVTRMRCWRITTLHNGGEKRDGEDYSLELSFEYLMARNQLQWITVSSEQAILMSVCLQAMIDELLIKSIGGSKNQDKSSSKSWIYMRRDGNSQVITTSPSVDRISKTYEDNDEQHRQQQQEYPPTKSEPQIMRKITERLSSVTVKKSELNIPAKRSVRNLLNKAGDYSSENNYAFHTIGDDDL